MGRKSIIFPSLQVAIGVAILTGLGGSFSMFASLYFIYVLWNEVPPPALWVNKYLVVFVALGLLLGGLASVSYWRQYRKDKEL